MRSFLMIVATVAAIAGSASAQPLPQKEPITLIPELTPAPPPPSPPRAAEPVAVVKPTVVAKPTERAEWLSRLGSLERASVLRALAAGGYEIDADPYGKQIDKIYIVNEEVFAEKNRVLRFFNNFHVTTREHVIRNELVIDEGETWDQERIDESVRRLRDPLWTSVVAAMPIVSKTETEAREKVSLLVVTRDVWSLRLNTKYGYAADASGQKLTSLSVSLSENNFLGRRAVLAYAFTMDQSEIATGPLFIDKNLFGKHLDLRVRADALLNRDRFTHDGKLVREGSDSTISLSKPLWSLASKWAAGAAFSHNYSIERSYRGTAIRTYDIPETPETEELPYIYKSKVLSASGNATRQWGKQLKQQVSLGYSVVSLDVEPYQFTGDDAQRDAFIRGVLPRSEVTSGPYIEYAGYQPIYKTLRNLQTYDLGEDARFGVDYSILFGAGRRWLGADANHWRVSGSAGYTLRWCRDGFVRASGAIAIRHQTGVSDETNFIDNSASGKLRFATPSIKYGRVVFDTTLATRWNDTQNRFYSIGSETGLRGFPIDEFLGDRVFNTQVEARSTPVPLWVFRIGGVVFYELGGASNALAHIPLHHDAGVGFRMLIPQTSRELFRFDLAFPLDGSAAGRPRFIAGFESAF